MLEEDVFEISDIVSVCVLGWKKKKSNDNNQFNNFKSR